MRSNFSIFFLLFILSSIYLTAQNPVFNWARMGKGSGIEEGRAVTTDAAGNIYTTGLFEGTVDFDPGAGTVLLTSAGGEEAFITKTSSAGVLVWAKSIGGLLDDHGRSIDVDASGNVYVCGEFEGTADLDPGAGVVNVTRALPSYTSAFVLKLNASGNYVWGKAIGGNGAAVRMNKLILDASANVFMTGALVYGPEDFDPGAGTANLTGIYEDAYILKWTTNGVFAWVKQIKGVNALDYTEAYDIEFDAGGNIIIAGNIHGDFDFDPNAGVAMYNSGVSFGASFIAKYTSAGAYLWAGVVAGGAGSTMWNSQLTVDNASNIYMTNYVNGSPIDFDITATVNNVTFSGAKTSILKLSSTGNFKWVKFIPNSWSVPIKFKSNALFLTGDFIGTQDFNPGPGVNNIVATLSAYGTAGGRDAYVLKLDTSGTYNWVTGFGSNAEDYSYDLALDASDNIITTGYFEGYGDFDPGPGVATLYCNGFRDIFIHKMNSSGTVQWAISAGSQNYLYLASASEKMNGSYHYATGTVEQSMDLFGDYRNKGVMDIFVSAYSTIGNTSGLRYMGGPGDDGGTAIVTDAAGNMYLTGYFEQTVDFSSGIEATTVLTASGGKDIFILKVDPSFRMVWAKRIGNTNDDLSTAIAVDNSGSLFLTGYFQGTVDFNPGIVLNSLTSAGNTDAFILKLDTAGNYVWARNVGGTNTDIANDVAIDGSGNVYITGSFAGTADLNPAIATTNNFASNGSSDAFIVKLNSSGNYIWGKTFGGTSIDAGRELVAATTGEITCAGNFTSTTDFDPNAGVFSVTPSGSLAEVFLMQLNSAGNFSWARSFGGTGSDIVNSMTTDLAGNFYLAGSFTGAADFDPRSGKVYNVASSGLKDAYILCYSTAIDSFWVRTYGGVGNDDVVGIATTPTHEIYTQGNFNSNVDFDINAPVFNLTANGPSVNYGLKIGQLSPLPVELLSFDAYIVDLKKVKCEWITASEINSDYFTVERSRDGVTFEDIGTVDGAGNSNGEISYAFTDDKPYPGTSYYRLMQTDRNGDHTYTRSVAVRFNDRSDIYIFPQPAVTGFYLSSELKGINAVLYSVQGKVIRSWDGIQPGSEMSVKDLANGMYTVKIFDGNFVGTHKLLVAH